MEIKETICIGESPYLGIMLKQCLKLKNNGYRIMSFIQAEALGKIDFEGEFRNACDELFIEAKTTTEKNSRTIIDSLRELLRTIEQSTNTKFPESIYIFCSNTTTKDLEKLAQEYNIKSVNCSKKQETT